MRRESSLRITAKNPVSSAFGLGQLIVNNRIRLGQQMGVNPNTINPYEQVLLFRSYVEERYGTAEAALWFWDRNGWY